MSIISKIYCVTEKQHWSEPWNYDSPGYDALLQLHARRNYAGIGGNSSHQAGLDKSARWKAMSSGGQNSALEAGGGKCGGAVGGMDGKTCQEALWGPTGDNNMPCFEYGSACTLNCHASNHDIGKDPSGCTTNDAFYLWDEPDTNCNVPDAYRWAGQTWREYAEQWESQIQTMRQNGFKFTTPLVKGDHIKKNLEDFYSGCGPPCSDESSPAYIDVNAVNAFCGSWNHGDCAGGAKFAAGEMESISQSRPGYITNWSYLGQDASLEKMIEAMEGTRGFFEKPSIKRVYWFGAKDVGGGSQAEVTYLTNTVPGTSETFGQRWASICSEL